MSDHSPIIDVSPVASASEAARSGRPAGGDAFRALGDEADSETLPGEVCYLDDASAVCRCWNWRDGVRTMLAESTTNAFLILESVDPARHDDLAAALDDLAARTQAALGGEMESHIVTKDSPAIALS